MTLDQLLVAVAAAILVGYFVSTFLHPFRPCRTCGGSGVQRGSIYRRSHRNCASCGGKGRFRRTGAPAEGRAFGEGRRR